MRTPCTLPLDPPLRNNNNNDVSDDDNDDDGDDGDDKYNSQTSLIRTLRKP